MYKSLDDKHSADPVMRQVVDVQWYAKTIGHNARMPTKKERDHVDRRHETESQHNIRYGVYVNKQTGNIGSEVYGKSGSLDVGNACPSSTGDEQWVNDVVQDPRSKTRKIGNCETANPTEEKQSKNCRN